MNLLAYGHTVAGKCGNLAPTRVYSLTVRRLGRGAASAPRVRRVARSRACRVRAHDRNPAKGKRRRVKGTEPRRSWVEVEQLPALIDAADPYLRPLVATMAEAGLRIGEATALDWRDVNLAAGTLTVREAKTAAGAGRHVDLPAGLMEELSAWKALSARTRPSDPVFATRSRKGEHARQTPRNVQARLAAKEAGGDRYRADLGARDAALAAPHLYERAGGPARRSTAFDRALERAEMGRKSEIEPVPERTPDRLPGRETALES